MFTRETETIRAALISQGYRIYHGNFAVSVWYNDTCVASVDWPLSAAGPVDGSPQVRQEVYRALRESVWPSDDRND